MKILNLIYLLLVLFLSPPSIYADDLTAQRIQLILQSMNQFPEEWVTPILAENIHINNGVGRVDCNEKSKFSYYVHIENPQSPTSKITLIPMATSRYTPTYYQTDEWWDANKEALADAKRNGTRAPRQDMNEVAEWLKNMKLSTNPLVFEITPGLPVQTKRLQTYLLEYYKAHFVKNGKVTLYRGGEKPTETDEWLQGRRPRGVRYWTPTAAYAWRYARKNRDFLEKLIEDKAPLYVFEVPLQEFENLVQRRWQRLTLGIELTKNAHNSFDQGRGFIDHLIGKEYMGIGDIGVEFELRSNSQGANDMLQYFQRPIRIEELVFDRIDLIQKTLSRIKKIRVNEVEALEAQYQARIEQALTEGKILVALREKMSAETVKFLFKELNDRYEVADIDFKDLQQFALDKIADLQPQPEKMASELEKLNSIFRNPFIKNNSCLSVL